MHLLTHSKILFFCNNFSTLTGNHKRRTKQYGHMNNLLQGKKEQGFTMYKQLSNIYPHACFCLTF